MDNKKPGKAGYFQGKPYQCLLQAVRSVLELAAPAWTPGLTKTEIYQLERIQKTACAIILGHNFQSYKSAKEILNMETLETRREPI